MKSRSPHVSYYQSREFSTELGGKVVHFVSKPGLLHWDQVTPATHLLSEVVNLAPHSNVMLLGVGNGVLGVALARQLQAGELWLSDTNVIALTMTQKTLDKNNVSNAHIYPEITMLPRFLDFFDTIVMELPKGRKSARRSLVEAHAALKLGGQLYIAGSNDEGIQSIIDDSRALFGNISILKYKKGNRAASATKQFSTIGDVEWAMEPGIMPGTWYEFDIHLEDTGLFHIHSLPGVFSFDKLDNGTKLLLPELSIPKDASVLDIGCGYGIIGMVAARRGAAYVDMIDVDNLSVASATKNIIHNEISNTHAFSSDALGSIGQRKYDIVVTNPPFHTGKTVDYDAAYTFIEHAHSILNAGGKFMLVANAFIRYDQLMRKLFNRVERLATDGRYHVLAAS